MRRFWPTWRVKLPDIRSRKTVYVAGGTVGVLAIAGALVWLLLLRNGEPQPEPAVAPVGTAPAESTAPGDATTTAEAVSTSTPEAVGQPLNPIRVFQLQGGNFAVLFDGDVSVGGGVRMVTDQGAIDLIEGGETENTSILTFDTIGLQGEVKTGPLYVDEDSWIRDSSGRDAGTDMTSHTFTVDQNRQGSMDRIVRPEIAEMRARGALKSQDGRMVQLNIEVGFSEPVWYSSDLGLLMETRSRQGAERGVAPLAPVSLQTTKLPDEQRKATLIYTPNSVSFVLNYELGDIHTVTALGLTEEGQLIADASTVTVRRVAAPLHVAADTGLEIDESGRCYRALAQVGYDNVLLQKWEATNNNLADEQRVLVAQQLEKMPAVQEICYPVWSERPTPGNGIKRNWRYSECIDSVEREYSGSLNTLKSRGVLADRWRIAVELVSRPYSSLIAQEKETLRGILSHEQCPLYYPQLWHDRWIPLE